MKKSEIETHSDGYRPSNPAINVKVRRMGITVAQVAEHFQCTQSIAQRAMDFAFESAQVQFWEQAKEFVADVFGSGVTVYSEGRSGGWLTLHGLPSIESWDALMVSKYARVANWCQTEIEYRGCRDNVIDDIDANQWAKPGAEQYNFITTAQGDRCIADLKQAAIGAGFGAVVRSPLN
jgi:hypothetical protein